MVACLIFIKTLLKFFILHSFSLINLFNNWVSKLGPLKMLLTSTLFQRYFVEDIFTFWGWICPFYTFKARLGHCCFYSCLESYKRVSFSLWFQRNPSWQAGIKAVMESMKLFDDIFMSIRGSREKKLVRC